MLSMSRTAFVGTRQQQQTAADRNNTVSCLGIDEHSREQPHVCVVLEAFSEVASVGIGSTQALGRDFMGVVMAFVNFLCEQVLTDVIF